MTGPRVQTDPYADLYQGAGASASKPTDDPYADLYETTARNSPVSRAVDRTQNTSVVDPYRPPSAIERAAMQVIDFGKQAFADPIGTAMGAITAPLKSADETFLRPVVGERTSGRYGKGGPLPGQLPPGTVVSPENSPSAVTRQKFEQAGVQTVANAAAPLLGGVVGKVIGPAAGFIAGTSPIGAAYSPDDPLAGAIAMPVMAGILHGVAKPVIDPIKAGVADALKNSQYGLRRTALDRLRPGADEIAGDQLRQQIRGVDAGESVARERVSQREMAINRLNGQDVPPLEVPEVVDPYADLTGEAIPEMGTSVPETATESDPLKSIGQTLARINSEHVVASAQKVNTRTGEVIQPSPAEQTRIDSDRASKAADVLRGLSTEQLEQLVRRNVDQRERLDAGLEPHASFGNGAPDFAAQELASRRLSASEKHTSISDTSEPETLVREAPPAYETPRGVVEMPTQDIKVDPARFQFKQNVDEAGTTRALKGSETYNRDLAGVVAVWRDPADGQVYVVNGHHRRYLAGKTGEPTMDVRFLNAASPEEARSQGAVINIAEGKGTPIDVAKFLRDSGMNLDALRKKGVDVNESLARDGAALARLSPDLFQDVSTGKIPHTHGVAIGEIIEDPTLQREAAKAVRGKRLSGDDVREVARQVQDAGTMDAQESTLFGDETVTKGLYVERAQLANAIKKTIAKDKALFGFLTKGGRAEAIEQAGAGKVDVDTAQQLADQSSRLDEVFTRLYTRSGALSTLLNEGAQRVARGEKATAVAGELYPRVTEAVRAALGESGVGATGRVEGRPAAVEAEGAAAEAVDPSQGGMFASRAPSRQSGPDLFGQEPEKPAQTALFDDPRLKQGYRRQLDRILSDEALGQRGMSLAETEQQAREDRTFLDWYVRQETDPHRLQLARQRLATIDRLLNRGEKISAGEIQTRLAVEPEPSTTENLPGQGAMFEHRTPGAPPPTSPPAGAAPATPTTPASPPVAKAAGLFTRMRTEIRRIFAPAGRTPQSQFAAETVRHHAADLALRTEQATEALKDFGKALGAMPEADRLDFIDRMETGGPQATPDLTAAAAEIRQWLDTARDDIQNLGIGALSHFIDDYFPHIWEDPQGASAIIRQMDAGKRPLTGSGRFLKQRTIPTTKDGIAAGLKPVSTNPVDLTLLKLREMHRFLAGQRILKELKEKNLIVYNSVFERKPAGWAFIEDKAGTVWGPPHVEVTEAFDAQVRSTLNTVIQNLGGLTHERKASVGRHGPGTTLGIASTGGDYMATRGATPDSVIEHELGHILDVRMGLWNKLKGNSAIVAELEQLADLRHQGVASVTKSFQKYVREPSEMIANAVNALIYAPDIMSTTAPATEAVLRRILGSDRRTRPLLEIQPSLVLETGKFDVPAGGFIMRGRYAAPEPVATVVNNYLSPGLAGNAMFDAYRAAGNVLNQAQLGLSAFHLGMVSIDSSVSSAALGVERFMRGDIKEGLRDFARGVVPLAAPVHTYLEGSKVLQEGLVPGSVGGPFTALVEAMKAGGGRVRQDQIYASEATKRFKAALAQGGVKGPLKAAVLGIPALLEKAAAPMMEHFVPRMKLGVFADLARLELEKLPPTATVEQVRAVMAKVWDSVDNRMGQLVYDNLFWHRITKDLAMASVRSVGWNLGTIREIAGGAADIAKQPIALVKGGKMELTHRGAYVVALPVVVGLYGAMYQYLRTGTAPQELKDYFFPKTGSTDPDGNAERVVLPSYMKDVFAYSRHPYQTIKNKLHPMVGMISDMLENKDFFGNEIRNPDDPILKQVAQEVEHVGKELVPMGVEKTLQDVRQHSGAATSAQNFIGITPAPKEETRSPAQNRMSVILNRRGHAQATPEEVGQRQERGQMLGDLRRGGGAEDIQAAVQSGRMTPRQGQNLLRQAHSDALVNRFKQLTLPEAIEVYGLGSPEEQQVWRPWLGRKAQSVRPGQYTPDQWKGIRQSLQTIQAGAR